MLRRKEQSLQKQAGEYLPHNKLPWIIESVPEPVFWDHYTFSTSSDPACDFIVIICFTGLCFFPKYTMLVLYSLQSSATSGIGTFRQLTIVREKEPRILTYISMQG